MKNLIQNFHYCDELPKRFRNRLYQYRGGGYDGCIWEWNYFIIDSEGTFVDIISTGYCGISADSKCVDFLKSIETKTSCDVYDLLSKQECERFCLNAPPQNVIYIFSKLESDYSLSNTNWQLRCHNCGLIKESDDFHLIGEHGCGGIAVGYDDFICKECYVENCCIECDDYCDSEELIQGYCKFCFEKIQEDYFIKNNMMILEYDDVSNSFYIDEDCDYRFINWEDMWIVDIHNKVGYQQFIVHSETEYNAIDYVSHYLNGNYYTAEASEFQNEVLESIKNI